MLSFEDLIEEIKKYNPNTNTRLINHAYDFGLAAHDGQMRKSGEPFFSHPLQVAKILTNLKLACTFPQDNNCAIGTIVAPHIPE